jgi:TldD protein
MRRRDFLHATWAGATLAACADSPTAASPMARQAHAPPSPNPFSEAEVAPLLSAALQAASEAGATYADARMSRHRDQNIASRELRITRLSDTRSEGIGIRVIVDGVWGFAATHKPGVEAAVATARLAVGIAKANRAMQGDPVRLAPTPPQVGRWETPIRTDAFDVPIEQKVEHLLGINKLALDRPGVSFVNSSMHFVREHKFIATTEGTWIEQVLHRCNPSFSVTSVNDKTGSFRSRNALCAPQGRSWGFIEDYDWDADVRQAAEDVVAMHTAKSVEPGRWDLILVPSHLWLTIHESIGHPTELDRALGYEANYAGTSFLTVDKMGTHKIGSDIVNFEAEKTAEGALATSKWDDDGVQTHNWPLVSKGVFVDYQTTREQAHWIDQTSSHGCSYASSWRDVAFQRMPNINLKPGTQPLTLDQLIGDTERAILIAGRGSYSIDHQRYNFQFGGQTFHEVRNGKVEGLLTDVAYVSNTTAFWNACDAICSDGYQVNGSFYDGKGEPGQSNAVSHGCAPSRFRNIEVLRTGGAA